MIVGTAGHIDHGKTSLIRALTGIETDRLKEEKARGISIDLGFAYMPTPEGDVLGFVDVPGHERFIHNMLAGATGIDFVLLAVAADDGPMPQTLEHLAIVDLLGVERGIVALTKADLVDTERLVAAKRQVWEALASTTLAEAEILPVSAATEEGVDELRAKLFAASQAHSARETGGGFRLAVDRSFTLQGAGTVVTGTIVSGKVTVGDQLLISPSKRPVRVRSIHVQDRPAEQGRAGDRCALNLAGEGVSKDVVSRGDIVLAPELHAPTERIDAILRVLPSEPKAVGQWMPVRLHHAAAEVGARLVLLGDEPIPPGEQGLIQLVPERALAAAVGDRFVIRDTSSQRTIGGGRFLDLRAPARKRRTPERRAQLAAHAIGNAEEALAALLDSPPGHIDLSAFARDRVLLPAEIDHIAAKISLVRLATPKGVLAVSAANWLRLKRHMIATLEAFHAVNRDLAGIGAERLRMQLDPALPRPAFLAILQGLTRSGDVALDGAWVKLPGHEVRLLPRDEALWSRILPLISGDERFRPPRVRDIAGLIDESEADVRRVLKLLGRMGRVDEVAHDHFFTRQSVADMVEIAVELASAGDRAEFSAAQLRDRLDNGRKVAIQILEFFDRHGVTLRRGDLRRINKHRLDLFHRLAEDGPDQAQIVSGRASSPVGRPDFKSGKGREPVLGGFDSHSLPPSTSEVAQ